MKFVLTIIVIFSFFSSYSQQISCRNSNDTLFIFDIIIFYPKAPIQQFWSTAKKLNLDSINTKSISLFISSFIEDKNYCPDLPGILHTELFKCIKDTTVKYIESMEKELYRPLNIWTKWD